MYRDEATRLRDNEVKELNRERHETNREYKKEPIMDTGWSCREAHNGNCTLKCKHSLPHRKNEECNLYCHRMKRKAKCIEVEFFAWDISTFQSLCGKKVTPDCKGEHQ